MAVVIEVLNEEGFVTSSSYRATVTEVVRAAHQPISTTAAQAVVSVVGPGHVANAVVSSTPPSNPYEGQIWIDVS